MELIFAYIAGSSPLYRYDPRLKLLLLILVTATVPRLPTFCLGAVILALTLLLVFWGPSKKNALRLLLSTLRFGLSIAALMFIAAFGTTDGPDFPNILAFLLRLICWILAGFLFTMTTSHAEIRGIVYRLSRVIPRLPASRFALLVSVSLATLPSFFTSATRVREAIICRGGIPLHRPLRLIRASTIPLLTRVVSRSERLSEALIARSFHDSREFGLPPLPRRQLIFTLLALIPPLFFVYLEPLLGYTRL